jgi:uncharacterized protein YukE
MTTAANATEDNATDDNDTEDRGASQGLDASEPLTNFAAFDDQQLLTMLYAGNPEKVRSIGDRWGVVSTSMREHADDIEADFGPVRESWNGYSATEYEKQIRSIVSASRTVAEMASILRDLIFSAADSLRSAQDLLPPPDGWQGHPTGTS